MSVRSVLTNTFGDSSQDPQKHPVTVRSVLRQKRRFDAIRRKWEMFTDFVDYIHGKRFTLLPVGILLMGIIALTFSDGGGGVGATLELQRTAAIQARLEARREAFIAAEAARMAPLLATAGQQCTDYHLLALTARGLPNPMQEKWGTNFNQLPPDAIPGWIDQLKKDGATSHEVFDSTGKVAATIWQRDWRNFDTPLKWEGVWRTVYVFVTPGACVMPPGSPEVAGGVPYLDFMYNDPGGGKKLLPPPKV